MTRGWLTFVPVSALGLACAVPHDTTPLPSHRSCPAPGADTFLTWFVPDTDDATEAEQWCRTLGPVVVDSVPDARFGSWEIHDSLTLGVWNVAGGSGYLTRFLETELGLDCAPGAPGPRQPIVLLLQEAFRRSADVPASPPGPAIPPRIREPTRPGDRPDVVDVARRCGLAFLYVPATRNGVEPYDGLREDKGNAILSTLPLTDFIAIELPMVAQRRVTIAATIRGPSNDSLRVVSMHLNNFPAPWRFVKSGGHTRVQQGLSVVDALAHVEQEPRVTERAGENQLPTIAAGDFNTWSAHETVLLQLRDHFPDSPPYQGKPTRTGFATDHVLYRKGSTLDGGSITIADGSYRRIDDTYYSDHYPLVVQFVWGSD